MNNEKNGLATEIWEQYQKGRAYQSTLGLDVVIPLCVDFYEGRQWGKVKKGTENFPRPMVNFVKMIVDNKRANLMSSPLRIVYKSDNKEIDTEKFNHFAEYWQKEARIKSLDSNAIKDGIIKGTYIYHYYWDSEATGRQGKVEGALRCQLVDVRNIVFSNPQEKDEQKQEWIIIASRATVKSVQDKLAENKKNEVAPDNETSDYEGQIDQEGTDMVTVLTKYYKKDGKVYFTKSTKDTMLSEEISLSPDLSKAREYIESKIASQQQDADTTNQTPDIPKKTENDNKNKNTAEYSAIYFPIVVGQYEEREGSIYGLGEVSGLINNQKTVNNILALQAYATENNAFGKIVVKGDALGNQQIDNRPGQILYDYSKINQQGIYRLQDPQLSEMPLNAVDAIMSLSRSVTGSTEVMSGEVLGKNMSGQAIAQLQSQALLPTEEKRQRIQDAKLKQGKIMEMFFRTHYDEDREFTWTDSEFNEETQKTEETMYKDVFNASDYKNELFDIVIEVTAGTRSSVSGDIAMLDMALQNGKIDFIDYIKLYPSDALSDKSKLIEELENSQKSEINALRGKVQQYEEQIKQLAGVASKQDEVVQKAVQCIKGYASLQQLCIKQNYEFAKKIEIANKQFQEQEATIKNKDQELSTMFSQSGDMFNRVMEAMSPEERLKLMEDFQSNQIQKAKKPM